MLFQTPIAVYGSVATGLDLEDSDVDVSIIGYENCNYNFIQTQLTQLHQKLSEMPFVVQSKIILGNIPLLKLELNPNSQFIESEYYIRQNRHLFYLNPQEQGKIISIDLTWNTQWGQQYVNQHNGFQSTQLIQKWIYIYPGFREIILILKYLLKYKNLNDAYQGGISSFCLTIMLAAIYISQKVLSTDKKQILLSFLDRYGNNFDPMKEAIDVCQYSSTPFILLEESPLHPPLTVYSPVNKMIISTKATRTKEILQEFQSFHKFLLRNNTIKDYFQNTH